MLNENYRILAKDIYMDNNTRKTNLNNNDIIIGPSGSGKTRGYVIPNILQANESMIIADVKGILKKQTEKILKAKGYKILNMNFMDLANSDYYNPLEYIRIDEKTYQYNIQDIKTISNCIVTTKSLEEPFWENAARMYLEIVIAYVIECLPRKEHNLSSVYKIATLLDSGIFETLINELSTINPESFAVKINELSTINPESFAVNQFNMIRANKKADKMHASILGILAEKLSAISINNKDLVSEKENKINFKDLGKEKIVLFTGISDTDRSMDPLANLFYTQALNNLCNSADNDYPDNRLAIPVRIILDNFAANIQIPDFDKTITTIRSREIYVSIILQSLSQLESAYGIFKSKTILNNADNLLYIGGQDIDTAYYISKKANKSLNAILNMSLEEGWLFTRGSNPRKIEKYNIEEHQKFKNLTY